MREAVAEVGSIGLSLWLVDAEKILSAVFVIWSQKAVYYIKTKERGQAI